MHTLSEDALRRLLAAARAVRERDWLMILVAFNHSLRLESHRIHGGGGWATGT